MCEERDKAIRGTENDMQKCKSIVFAESYVRIYERRPINSGFARREFNRRRRSPRRRSSLRSQTAASESRLKSLHHANSSTVSICLSQRFVRLVNIPH